MDTSHYDVCHYGPIRSYGEWQTMWADYTIEGFERRRSYLFLLCAEALSSMLDKANG